MTIISCPLLLSSVSTSFMLSQWLPSIGITSTFPAAALPRQHKKASSTATSMFGVEQTGAEVRESFCSYDPPTQMHHLAMLFHDTFALFDLPHVSLVLQFARSGIHIGRLMITKGWTGVCASKAGLHNYEKGVSSAINLALPGCDYSSVPQPALLCPILGPLTDDPSCHQQLSHADPISSHIHFLNHSSSLSCSPFLPPSTAGWEVGDCKLLGASAVIVTEPQGKCSGKATRARF